MEPLMIKIMIVLNVYHHFNHFGFMINFLIINYL